METLAKRLKLWGTWTKKIQRIYDNINKEATDIMLTGKKYCVPTFHFHTPWSVPLIKDSRSIKYWNLKLPLTNSRKVSQTVLEEIRDSATLKDYTSTRDHILTKRNLAQIHIQDLIANADKTREAEL